MIAIAKMFEEANVHSEHPSGLVAPFGSINPSDRSRKLLAQVQDMTMKNPDEQARIMNKLRGF